MEDKPDGYFDDDFDIEIGVALIKAELEIVLAGKPYTHVVTALLELIARKTETENDTFFVFEQILELLPAVARKFEE